MAEETPVTPPANTHAPKEPETFSREYVVELRNESKSYRLKLQDAEKKAQDAAEAVERATKDKETALTEAQQKANDRILRSELKAAALKAGMIDLDGLKLADLSKVKLLESGDIEGAEALMEQMKKEKAYLFGAASSTSSTAEKPKPGDTKPKKATEMTDEEYKAARKKAAAGKL